MKLITFTKARMINQITLDTNTHVTVLISLQLVLKQCALDANLILIIICHVNALGNAPHKQLGHNNFNNNNNGNRHKINQHSEPNLQLSVSTYKLDQMARKITKYFKQSLKHNSSHSNNTSNYQSNKSKPHPDKHKCKSHYHKDDINEITTDTYTPNQIATQTDNTQENTDLDSFDSTTDSASDSK